jgi:phosphoesterase RecJ-like protein
MAAFELSLPAPLVSRFRALISHATHIVVTVHRYPDEDALGAALACKLSLGQQKPAICYCPAPLPPLFSAYRHLCSTQKPLLNRKTLVICCDTVPSRTHLAKEIKTSNCSTVVIDHHPAAHDKRRLNLTFASASSASEIMTRLLISLQHELTPYQATLLLSGILVDCGFFQYPNTSALTLRVAAFLVARGAHPASIFRLIKKGKRLADYKIRGLALRRLRINSENAALSVITQKDLRQYKANFQALNGLANYLGTIPHTRYALLLAEFLPGRIKGSLRAFSAQEKLLLLAKSFGGGGHQQAAGFRVRGSIIKRGKYWQLASPPASRLANRTSSG